eukprot:14738369-Ditylum_brightwellii.AAC.1
MRGASDKAPEEFLITMAAPSLHYLLRNVYHLSKLSTYFDWFNVMVYDMGAEWMPEVGSHTDMAIVDDIVQYFLLHGVPSEKIVLELAAFGCTFTHKDPLCDKVRCPTQAQPGNGIDRACYEQ